MTSAEKRFRSRWCCFVGEPWFDAMADAWWVAFDRDDEHTEQNIVEKLFQTAEQRGIAIVAECRSCDKPKPLLQRDTVECAECTTERAETLKAQAEWKERWEAATPEERATWPTLCADGIIRRDVQ
jgi:glutaredoxin